MKIKSIVNNLLDSKEPAVRLKTYLLLLDHDYETKEVKDIRKNLIKNSDIFSLLLSFLPKDEKSLHYSPYKKWQGLHWILADLADLFYPPGDNSLIPSRNIELNWLLSEKRWRKKPIIEGRKRFCASQEGNGLFSVLILGLDDERCTVLADRLIKYQWVDGGWNCDKKPEAINSSYNESLIPMRALNVYSNFKGDKNAKMVVERASELFLKRKLFRKIGNNEVISPNWIKLRYPSYWMYNIFYALKVMAEIGKIKDPRCKDALDILESKMLPTGGFKTDGKDYQSNHESKSRYSPVNWAKSGRKMNEWVTIDAFYILKKAGRIKIEM